MFQYQTGHYGFAYNCDGEECKRNNPAICWQKADQCQLPRRMGCLERLRHEAAQVSQRILDGSCNSGCSACQQQSVQSVHSNSQTCGCGNCLANHDASNSRIKVASSANPSVNQSRHSHHSRSAKHAQVKQAAVAPLAATPVSTSRRRSGLISLTYKEPATGVELNPGEVLIGEVEVLHSTIKATQPAVESVRPPVARITSVAVGSGLDSIVEVERDHTAIDVTEATPPSPPASTHRMGLMERMNRAQSLSVDSAEEISLAPVVSDVEVASPQSPASLQKMSLVERVKMAQSSQAAEVSTPQKF